MSLNSIIDDGMGGWVLCHTQTVQVMFTLMNVLKFIVARQCFDDLYWITLVHFYRRSTSFSVLFINIVC